MNAGLVDWCKTKEQGKEEVTAIATRQKESKFKAFMQKIKMALTRNKNKEQDNERKQKGENAMTDVEYRNSLYELSEIFKILDKSLIAKIPQGLKDIIAKENLGD